jgi:hypothetical protein
VLSDTTYENKTHEATFSNKLLQKDMKENEPLSSKSSKPHSLFFRLARPTSSSSVSPSTNE